MAGSSDSITTTNDDTVRIYIHNSRTIASIVMLSAIILAVMCAIGTEKYWKKLLRNIFTRKKTNRGNKWFLLKRWFLLIILLLINIGAIIIIYLYGNERATISIVIITKAKDIICATVLPLYYRYKICTPYNSKRPLVDGNQKTIVSIISVYKETLEEIVYTMGSIIYNSIRMYRMVVVIICHGIIPNVDSLIDEKKATDMNLEYRSWKNADVKCEINYGYRGRTPLVIFRKERNMEKKDSLILAYDVFNQPRTNAAPSCINFRTAVLEKIQMLFGIDKYDYMFFTDADSFIKVDSLTQLIDGLEYRNVTAACGLVMVDFEGHCGVF